MGNDDTLLWCYYDSFFDFLCRILILLLAGDKLGEDNLFKMTKETDDAIY